MIVTSKEIIGCAILRNMVPVQVDPDQPNLIGKGIDGQEPCCEESSLLHPVILKAEYHEGNTEKSGRIDTAKVEITCPEYNCDFHIRHVKPIFRGDPHLFAPKEKG